MWYASVLIWFVVWLVINRSGTNHLAKKVDEVPSRIEATTPANIRGFITSTPSRRDDTARVDGSGDPEFDTVDPHEDFKRLVGAIQGHKIGGDTPDSIIARRNSFKRIERHIQEAHRLLGIKESDFKKV